MSPSVRFDARSEERLIGALVPGPVVGRLPAPPPLPSLPVLALPVDAGPGLLFETARLDRSGRLFACGLLRALRWPPGHQVEIDAIEGALVIGSAPGGRHTVGDRGDLALPAALRRLCGIVPGPPILLVASVPEDRLVAHRASTVVRLLGELHALLVDGADDVG